MSKQNQSSGVQMVRVDSDRAGQRLDNFLSARLKGVPRSAIYRMIRTGQVRINGSRCKASSRLHEGDEVRIPPAQTRERGEHTVSDAVCRQIESALIYEDEDVLVVDKPSGMAVHSGSGLPWGLIDVVRKLRTGEFIELVHRLDRETSGCLVLARSGAALNHLSALFREGGVDKRYLCLMNGVLREALTEVDVPLLKIQRGGQAEVEVSELGKPALTRFKLLQSFSGSSYTEAELLTGRTHQIRVHAKHIGHPLAGDDRYADKESVRTWRKQGLSRLFLHAHRLAFVSPSGEPFSIEAPLPEKLRAVLDQLEA
jgi:23S rRNA pseudouridine955/2504/2580 synthase